jgi:large subunit ribosomal protein L21
MYAIVEIAGQQYKVQKDQQVYVHRLEGDAGAELSFAKVLLVEDGGKVEVGAPVIDGAVVNARLVDHLKGDKVIIFKKKRRKGYQKKQGHRQFLTLLEITGIQVGAAAPKAKKATKKQTEETPAAEQAEG